MWPNLGGQITSVELRSIYIHDEQQLLLKEIGSHPLNLMHRVRGIPQNQKNKESFNIYILIHSVFDRYISTLLFNQITGKRFKVGQLRLRWIKISGYETSQSTWTGWLWQIAQKSRSALVGAQVSLKCKQYESPFFLYVNSHFQSVQPSLLT